MYESLNWLAPKSRRQLHWSLFIFKCIHFNYPPYLKHYLIPFSSQYRLRHTDHLFFLTPRISKEIGRRAFKFKAPSDWNNLPCSLRSITSFHIFKSSLLTHLQTSCSCYWSLSLWFFIIIIIIIIIILFFFLFLFLFYFFSLVMLFTVYMFTHVFLFGYMYVYMHVHIHFQSHLYLRRWLTDCFWLWCGLEGEWLGLREQCGVCLCMSVDVFVSNCLV